MYYLIKYRIKIIFIVCLSSGFLINDAQCLSQKFKVNRFNHDFSDSSFLALLRESYPTISLDLGTPNLVPPTFLRNSLAGAAKSWNSTFHQYAPSGGVNELTKEIALLYSHLIHRELDPTKNVIVTVGATEAIYLTVMAHTLPGDEWILIQPSFAAYPQVIQMAHGKLKYVQLKPATGGVVSSADWTFDRREMTEAFNEKTKGIIVNTPHNPTGKIFTEEELRFIADLANKWDVLVLIDEVYEWFMYDSNQMIRMASLSEEIFHRSVMVNSISKSYVATGWRLGWAIGPAEIIDNLKKMQAGLLNSHSVPIQMAVAEGMKRRRYDIGRPNSFTSSFAKLTEMKRDKIVDTLLKIGATPVIPQSGFFVIANYTALQSKATGLEFESSELHDVRFVHWLAKKLGILLFPGSFFFKDNEKLGEDYVRINIVMKNETIEEASQRLLDWFL